MTLGQQPGLLALQAALARQAGGKDPVIESVPQGATLLRELLGEKRCLLVVDDVWEADIDGVRRRGGLGARLLITTRDRQILTGLGAETHGLDALDLPGALSLLASWAGAPPPFPRKRPGSRLSAAVCRWRWRSPAPRYGRGSTGRRSWRRWNGATCSSSITRMAACSSR